MPVECTVVGSIIMDLSVYMSRFPNPGETFEGKEFVLGFGGKGANQAVMANKLGCQVQLVGKVGADNFGGDYLNYLESIGINTDCIKKSDGTSTGVAQILVDDDGRNTIIVIPAANRELTRGDVDDASEVLRQSKVVVAQLEVPIDVVRYSLSLAKQAGAFTILNPAPIPKDFVMTDDFFRIADVICPNESEAAILFPDFPCQTLDDFRVIIDQMHSLGCPYPIITLGEQGALVRNEQGKIIHVETPKVKATDTTGAGDSFVGSLAFFLCRYPNLSLEEKVRRAVLIASISVQTKGTQASFPSRRDLSENLFL